MFTHKILLPALFAIGLAFGLSSGGAVAAQDHSHDGHAATVMELSLNAGQKWHGDESMHKGMDNIRRALTARLDLIHDNRLPAQDYKTLATAIQEQVDYMVENCKLPPAADEQLHIVLAQVLEGSDEMEEGSQARSGAVKVVQALNAYGQHFEHPGWQPLGK